MQLTLTLNIPSLPAPVKYTDKLLLIGSCFTENIGERLTQHKFNVLSNPNGILFNPLSVAHSLNSYINNKQYVSEDLFYLNELWNSWDHHTRFSHTDADQALAGINLSQQKAATFVKEAGWVVITLGSAFQYYHKELDVPVANNHRAPAQWFEKRLLSIEEITAGLAAALHNLFVINKKANVLLTISPVRHIRDGVVDNNRSKARLIDAVHQLCGKFEQVHYFPAYELVIDILRDYRYYDIDFVHPNYLATSFVWEHFTQSCIAEDARQLMKEVQDIAIARAHKPRFPETEAHRQFKAGYAGKVRDIQSRCPFLDMESELAYFTSVI